MSSAGRGKRLGGDGDFYPTPDWCVHRLLEAWKPPVGYILEPGAGDGAIIRAANFYLETGHGWVAIEKDPDLFERLKDGVPPTRDVATYCGDVTDPSAIYRAVVNRHVRSVIGNPPFSIAESVIRGVRKALPGAEIVLLLSLNFNGSAEREDFRRTFGEPDLFILPDRPQFKRAIKKGSDSVNYAWFRWPPFVRSVGEVRTLRVTSPEERGVKPRRKAVAA